MEAYPLQWSPSWPRSKRKEYSRFGPLSIEHGKPLRLRRESNQCSRNFKEKINENRRHHEKFMRSTGM